MADSVLVHNMCRVSKDSETADTTISNGEADGKGPNGIYEKADYHGKKNNSVKTKLQIKDRKPWINLFQ